MIEELLPCPFCGRDAECLHIYAGEEIVRCENEGCHVRPSVACDDMDTAMALWNQRAPDVESREKKQCRHQNVSIEYDHLFCKDCFAVRTDSQWGPYVSNRWFSSMSEAKKERV